MIAKVLSQKDRGYSSELRLHVDRREFEACNHDAFCKFCPHGLQKVTGARVCYVDDVTSKWEGDLAIITCLSGSKISWDVQGQKIN